MTQPIIHTFSTLPHSTHLFLHFTISVLYTSTYGATPASQLIKGFKATPDPSITTFQPLLTDPTNNFSLSFLRVNQTQLTLSIIHVPSGEPLWQATTSNSLLSARWDKSTKLIFNGSLAITDTHTGGVFWSTNTNGDLVVISNTSNLLIIVNDNNGEINNFAKSLSSPLWQSFHFPYDTLVQNQNFTSSMTLHSSNQQYTMRLGHDFIGLYAKFNKDQNQIYFKHGALEAKADIIPGHGPIYIRLNSDGWLGMYQNETKPVDVEPFYSYQRSIPGILRLRLESDGNLKGYYWSGSSWELNYQAITSTCELPSPCGSYGLCKSGHGCSCLNNQTETQSEGNECYPGQSVGDFCNGSGEKYKVLRRTGLELPFKELMGYIKTSTLDECEEYCEKNCTCWGAVYNNATGFCYTLDYPIQTLLDVEDDSKVGYFKVKEGVGKKKMDVGLGVWIGLLCVALLLLCGASGFGVYKLWKRKRRVKGYLKEEDDLGVAVPYKDLLGSSSSFGSIELNSNNRR